MIHLLQHLLSIVSGVAAVAVNVAILAALGSAMTLIPGKRLPSSLPDVVVPAACLVALFCWYGIKLNVPLPMLLGAVACLAVAIFTYRVLRDGPATALAASRLPTLFTPRSTAFALSSMARA